MKVIMPISHLFCPEIPNADKNQSGFSYMARNIADELGKYCELKVLTQSSFVNDDTKVGTFIMLKKTILDLVFSFSFFYFFQAVKYSRANQFTLKKTMRVIIYFITGAYLERIIKREKPDIIFIQEEADYSFPFLLSAARLKVNIVVTSHGLGCLNRDVVNMTDFQAKCEESIFSICEKYNIKVTVISTGMKERMAQKLKRKLDNVTVISNFLGEDMVKYAGKELVIEKKTIKKVVCVGSVYPLKNQKQLIDAINIYNNSCNAEAELYIVGDGPELKALQKYVIEQQIKNIKFTGRISHEEVCKQYMSADVVAFPSINDGFGLPVLEGYLFGKPAVMFSDLDSFKDLYDSGTMIGVYTRTTEDLENGIKKALEYSWNEEYIKDFAKSFSKEVIGKKYYKVLKEGNNPFPMEYFKTIYS